MLLDLEIRQLFLSVRGVTSSNVLGRLHAKKYFPLTAAFLEPICAYNTPDKWIRKRSPSLSLSLETALKRFN